MSKKTNIFYFQLPKPNAPEAGAQAPAGAAGAKHTLPDAIPDRNGDGQSDYQEFSTAFQSSGLSQQQIKYLFPSTTFYANAPFLLVTQQMLNHGALLWVITGVLLHSSKS